MNSNENFRLNTVLVQIKSQNKILAKPHTDIIISLMVQMDN